MKMLLIVLVCIGILLITSAIGIFLAIQIDVYFSKGKDLKSGEHINYLPERIVKLETEYKGGGGIHFLGESGKLYRCDGGNQTCEVIESPEKLDGQPAFRETDALYRKFAPPPAPIKQTVLNQTRGLMSHHNERQYALLEDGRVWYWFFSGNELNQSVPFWHLEHWLTIFLGAFGGLFAGLLISVFIWLKMFPRV